MPDAPQSMAWPCACKDRGSCERHRRCMYAGCNHRQREIASEIDVAIARLKEASVQQSTDQPLDRDVWLVAATLDHPSVYMGGPSRQSIEKAERVLKTLRRHGYRVEYDEKMEGVDADGR